MQPDTTRTETTFSTANYWLAAALLAAGQKLVRLEWQEGRAFFIFPEPEKCEGMSRAHWTGELMVSTKNFSEAVRSLKSRLYDDKNKYDRYRNTPLTR